MRCCCQFSCGILFFVICPWEALRWRFSNYRYDMGLWHSPWVGLLHFKTMFQDAEFWRAFSNTADFQFRKLLFHFPIPIIVAILLNEIRHPRVKKFFQTVFTFPHFISWVVLSGILINMFASNGIINQLLGQMGSEQIAAADVSFRLSPVYLDLKYLEGVWVGRHHLYGGTYCDRPPVV